MFHEIKAGQTHYCEACELTSRTAGYCPLHTCGLSTPGGVPTANANEISSKLAEDCTVCGREGGHMGGEVKIDWDTNLPPMCPHGRGVGQMCPHCLTEEEITPKEIEEAVNCLDRNGQLSELKHPLKRHCLEPKPLNFIINEYVERNDVRGLAEYFRAYITDELLEEKTLCVMCGSDNCHAWEAELAELLDENKPTKIRDFVRSLLSRQKAEILSTIKGIGCEEGIDSVTIAKVINKLYATN